MIAGAVLIFIISLIFPPAVLAELQPLGSYRIRISSMVSPANAQNAVLAGSILNGRVVEPGEIFSYNDTVGERTAARGFIPGYISTTASNPTKSIGGGVCTTASILHQAVKASGLMVIERHNHVAPTSYLPQGEDAAIWYGIEDYKFQNTRGNPVMIDAGVKEECLQISIMEMLPDKAVEPGPLQDLDWFEESLQTPGSEREVEEADGAIIRDSSVEDDSHLQEVDIEEIAEVRELNYAPMEINRLDGLVYAVSLNSLQFAPFSGHLPHHYSVLSVIGQRYFLNLSAVVGEAGRR